MYARIINIVLGVWLMASPAILGYEGPARLNNHIAGPIVVASAIMAISQVTRPLRWINAAIGLWLVAAPWVLGYATFAAVLANTTVGLLLIVFALEKGKDKHRIGGGWTALWNPDAAAEQEAQDAT